jgi:uncharacterized membrane protein (UPF0127 family)
LKIINATKPEQPELMNIGWCESFLKKGLGLMFTKTLAPNEGLILAEKHEGRLNTSIHMFFMHFDITVLWLDRNQMVVDKALAKKWRPIYLPDKPAQYVVELHKTQFNNFAVGDKLIFVS